MARPNTTPETRSVRLLKVGEQVRHVISDLLTRQEVHDDVLSAHAVSVTEVRMSPDLRHAADEISATLAEHPSDPLLQELLVSTYQRELQFMSDVNSIPTQSPTRTDL